MLEFGYVRLYRSLLNWEWYTDSNTKDVFIHLILTANYEPKKWRGKTIERGQRVASYASLASELKLSVKSVRTALNHLKSTGEVAILSNHEYSIITIKNYESYQDGANQTANLGQSEGKPRANEGQQCKKAKESNKARKIIYSDYRDAFLKYCPSLPKPETCENWLDNRKKRIRDKKMTVEEMSEVFKRVEASDFLAGRIKEFQCSIDWILEPKNWKKIIEGNYDNRGPKKPEHKPSYDLEEYERMVNSPEYLEHRMHEMGG